MLHTAIHPGPYGGSPLCRSVDHLLEAAADAGVSAAIETSAVIAVSVALGASVVSMVPSGLPAIPFGIPATPTAATVRVPSIPVLVLLRLLGDVKLLLGLGGVPLLGFLGLLLLGRLGFGGLLLGVLHLFSCGRNPCCAAPQLCSLLRKR